MGDLSEHLSRHEVACKCGCGMAAADIELVGVIEGCADYFLATAPAGVKRVAVEINSWNRCVERNEVVQKQYNKHYVPYSSKTQHLRSWATDFWLQWVYTDGRREKINDDLIADYLEATYPDKYGIGRYSNRTHADCRPDGPKRWDER